MNPDLFKKTPVFVKSAFQDLPTWEDIILNFDYEVNNNRIDVKNFGDLGVATHHGENIPAVNNIKKQIQALRPNEKECTAHIYVSFLTKSKNLGAHKDGSDVFYIQALGKTFWEVDFNRQRESYLLEPGDLIYIPKGVVHNPIPKSPRVGISIGF